METQRAMTEAAADPEYKPYDQHDLTVTEWQGVQVTSPVSATAMFLAYESWRDAGTATWQQDPILQYQVVLAKEGDKWKLADEAAFDPGERPPVDPAETPSNGYPRMP